MIVREAMTEEVLTLTPRRTLREAAEFMTEHKVGAAIILDPEQPGPGIITERDLVRALGGGQDPDVECVEDHLTAEAAFAHPDWSLEDAADAMAKGGFRHLVVVENGDVTGIISMRDIMRVWRPKGRHACESGTVLVVMTDAAPPLSTLRVRPGTSTRSAAATP